MSPLEKIAEERRPSIIIYASEANSEQYATMQKLAEALPQIEPLLNELGVRQIEFMPALPRGNYTPQPGVDFEMFITPGPRATNSLSTIGMELSDAIYGQTRLTAKIANPLKGTQREVAVGKYGLKAIAKSGPEVELG